MHNIRCPSFHSSHSISTRYSKNNVPHTVPIHIPSTPNTPPSPLPTSSPHKSHPVPPINARKLNSSRKVTKPKLNTRQTIPHTTPSPPAPYTITSPKLTSSIPPPAPHAPVRYNSTRVTLPTRHRYHTPISPNIHKWKSPPHPIHTIPTRQKVPQPKLPIQILPPALDKMLTSNSTHMSKSSRHPNCSPFSPKINIR
mmetsp:Transcript_32317/g.82324  ORF Transcript_32317/g.82324 Transcript_32317/m.82324 type:complete len:197 (-) Transcript_32317:413-1003(-)